MLRAALEAQAPPKQTATDTINTLSSRLAHATLLEDRRAAIQGLRSFAKEYPASVASGSLRGLIQCLNKDIEDIDTGKVVLETLLNLFNPDDSSPEASDDISLWLADEFSQRQDNITVLLNLLDNTDFYSRLYALQLLTAISTARPERTQECILSAPLGTNKLVSVLNDAREPVRAAGLLLLNEVTQSSPELQKLVAFEGAFEQVFDLISSEGGLSQGDIVVQDCLSLLANLIHLNASNQNSFRESGFVPKLAQVLADDGKHPEDSAGEDLEPGPMRDKNLWGLLALLRMFLVEGNVGTKENQVSFVRHGLLHLALNLGFNVTIDVPIRAEALRTCADMIRGNAQIQEGFGSNQVTIGPSQAANGQSNGHTHELEQVYVIDGLLDLTLTASLPSMFDARYAACECVQAYFYNHKTIRLHFVDRAIYGYTSGEDETSNIINVLTQGPSAYEPPDPYRVWFAAILAFRLLHEEPEAKSRLRAVTEGDAEKGEEVIPFVQSLTGQFITALHGSDDGRIIVGYLVLLCGWLFEDADAVNDLLGEGSIVQTIISAIARPDKEREVEHGLCAMLLGILYEFSTKDSPIPRRKLQPLLLNGLGREKYVHRLRTMRENAILREFEVTPQNSTSSSPGTLPEVYLDQAFVEFFKDNYSRLARALDRDPGIETARPLEGIDRDLVDNLRAQISDKEEALQKTEAERFKLNGSLEQAQAEVKRAEDRCSQQRATMQSTNDRRQVEHESEVSKLKSNHTKELGSTQDKLSKELADVRSKAEKDAKDAKSQMEKAMQDARAKADKEIKDARARADRELQEAKTAAEKAQSNASSQSRAAHEQHQGEIAGLKKRTSELEAEAKKAGETIEQLREVNAVALGSTKERDGEITNLKDSKKVLEEDIERKRINIRNLEKQIKDQEEKLKKASEHEKELQSQVAQKEEARSAAQTELDDLFVVLGDLEEKRTRDKKKLKELGAETSDADEEDEEEDEDESEDESEDENGPKSSDVD